MNVARYTTHRPESTPVLVIGEFDGWHRGHQHLIEVSARLARLGKRPLGAVVLDVTDRPRVLTNVADRTRSLLAAGASTCRVLRVTLEGDDRVTDEVAAVIADAARPELVVMACAPDPEPDHVYPDLMDAFRQLGHDVIEVDRRADRGGLITSRRLRAAIETGDVAAASDMIGRPYTIRGVVQHGQQLGRTIGFPTANIEPPTDRVIPAIGVYAGEVTLDDGSVVAAAINIGVRPTVDNTGVLRLEAHLLDFDRDLYDSTITISLVERIRGEHRFESLDALTDQLARDVATVRARR